jgi:hypothetical protein
MSNALAIATVTDTLRSLIATALQELTFDANVTVQPPDKAHDDPLKHFVNLFLYQVLPNAAWRNVDVQSLIKPGSTSISPLALNLYYMLTAYSQGDDLDPPNVSTTSHQLLGQAMSALYDGAILLPGDIVQAKPDSDLQNQIDRVRITLQPLSVEEIFRLWSGFQSQYRISVAYEVGVVLIDSTQIPRTALPVRTPNIAARSFRMPVIEKIAPDFIVAGQQITLQGRNLKADSILCKIGETLLPAAKANISEKQLTVTLPATLQAGVNTIQVVQGVTFGAIDDQTQRPIIDLAKHIQIPLATDPHQGGFESNILPFVLHPTLDKSKVVFGRKAQQAPSNVILPIVTVVVDPAIGATQRVALLLNGLDNTNVYSFNASARAANSQPINSIDVPVVGAANGLYLVRLMVDGADSSLEVDTDSNSPTLHQFIEPHVEIV